MPAPKAFLRQMAQFNLDPEKAYTKADIGKDGHIKNIAKQSVVIPTPKSMPKKEETSKAKPTEAAKSASAAASLSKSDKSIKSASTKSTVEVKNMSLQVQVTGEKASDESIVESKESIDPAAPTDVGVNASTVKST